MIKPADFEGFQWLNESAARFEGAELVIHAPAQSDYFRHHGAIAEEGITPGSMQNAPFYYTQVQGDLLMRVRVRHAFQDTYDACAIMVMQSDTVWGKACFEQTDFGTHAVVSVVTNGVSDDANGCNIEGDSVWLQVCRVGNSFAFHYSLDGVRFDMMRFFYLPADETIKVGLVAQAPQGGGGDRYFRDLTLTRTTVKNIRAGA
ncbi:MAG: DUF1349 domain-containing protein [Anaerolineae bacterium]